MKANEKSYQGNWLHWIMLRRRKEDQFSLPARVISAKKKLRRLKITRETLSPVKENKRGAAA